jgi:hypothetical protein
MGPALGFKRREFWVPHPASIGICLTPMDIMLTSLSLSGSNLH